MTTERVLIFGGTFDPPHLAHETLPPLVASRLGCGRILYVPAAMNPLKADRDVTPAEHRLAMLRLAIADVPGAEIDTLELDRPGPSYTVDTLEMLRERLGDGVELHLLMGSDQAIAFHEWKDWSRILELATPAVMVRPPLDRSTFATKLRATYNAAEAQRWIDWSIAVPQMDVGATELRRRLAHGEDTQGLLAPEVHAYIRRHDLYA